MLKFLIHILNSTDSLVSTVYDNIKNSSIWAFNIKDMLNKLGFSHLNLNHHNIELYINTCRIQQRLHDQTKQNMNSLLTSCEKLSFFRSTYIPNKRPAYIDLCKYKTDRSIISQFRTSAHK